MLYNIISKNGIDNLRYRRVHMTKVRNNKKSDIKTSYKYKEMLRIMDKAEYQEVDLLTLSKIADYISWLSKFHKLPKDEIDALAIRMTDIFDLQKEF